MDSGVAGVLKPGGYFMIVNEPDGLDATRRKPWITVLAKK
ncbi:hypothetical protein BRYFOR_06800 [Marvinbryantia formatexigens DSM 14469]|uniref:Methyltransferase n=1 Tax=Marvinbryantia formatexigens DSM 14469 TaxID=478749 RepID=C6LDV1_9FIRM|nr:hypothetical protein BRYFOR_06800 [Marvinbryantia formatexigens DSM 14469]